MKRFAVLALPLVLTVLGCNVDSGAGSDPFQKLNHEQVGLESAKLVIIPKTRTLDVKPSSPNVATSIVK